MWIDGTLYKLYMYINYDIYYNDYHKKNAYMNHKNGKWSLNKFSYNETRNFVCI